MRLEIGIVKIIEMEKEMETETGTAKKKEKKRKEMKKERWAGTGQFCPVICPGP